MNASPIDRSSRMRMERRPLPSPWPSPRKENIRLGWISWKKLEKTRHYSYQLNTPSTGQASAGQLESSRYPMSHQGHLRKLPLHPQRRNPQQIMPQRKILRIKLTLVSRIHPPHRSVRLPLKRKENRRYPTHERFYRLRWDSQIGLLPLVATLAVKLREKFGEIGDLSW